MAHNSNMLWSSNIEYTFESSLLSWWNADVDGALDPWSCLVENGWIRYVQGWGPAFGIMLSSSWARRNVILELRSIYTSFITLFTWEHQWISWILQGWHIWPQWNIQCVRDTAKPWLPPHPPGPPWCPPSWSILPCQRFGHFSSYPSSGTHRLELMMILGTCSLFVLVWGGRWPVAQMDIGH